MNIHLCIYNIQSRPFLDNVCYKADHIGPRLNAFDLVCLQEAFYGDHRLCDNTNFKYKVNPEKKRYFYTLVDYGLLTLSSMKIQSCWIFYIN